MANYLASLGPYTEFLLRCSQHPAFLVDERGRLFFPILPQEPSPCRRIPSSPSSPVHDGCEQSYY